MSCGDGRSSGSVVGVGGVLDLVLPKEKVLPAAFRLNFDVDLGIGGNGMLLNGLSCGDLHSSV